MCDITIQFLFDSQIFRWSTICFYACGRGLEVLHGNRPVAYDQFLAFGRFALLSPTQKKWRIRNFLHCGNSKEGEDTEEGGNSEEDGNSEEGDGSEDGDGSEEGGNSEEGGDSEEGDDSGEGGCHTIGTDMLQHITITFTCLKCLGNSRHFRPLLFMT